MNQAALNLTAITIFTLVLSTLLGPLIHLPAAIPAIAVATVMGLGAVDTLGWQGQGSTLLLDWTARLSQEYRDRILHHEAGHFLVSYYLGIPVTGYTLSAWEAFRRGQPGAGGVAIDTTALDAEIERGTLSAHWVDRLCTVWMAGIAAESLTYGNSEGGEDDRQKIRMLWLSLKRPTAESQLKAKWALLQARTLLETHAEAYQNLVAAMQRRAEVSECEAILAASA